MGTSVCSDLATLINSGATGLAITKTVCRLLIVPSNHSSRGSLDTAGHTAYPPDCSLAVLPSNIYFTWTEVSAEKFIVADAMRLLAARLVKARIQDRQDLRNAVPCVNYAFFGTPVEAMCAAAYGANQSRLREIKKKYDPDDVMGLAGRWIINV